MAGTWPSHGQAADARTTDACADSARQREAVLSLNLLTLSCYSNLCFKALALVSTFLNFHDLLICKSGMPESLHHYRVRSFAEETDTAVGESHGYRHALAFAGELDDVEDLENFDRPPVGAIWSSAVFQG